MRIVKLKKWQLLSIVFTSFSVLCLIVIYATLEIRNTSVYSELNSTTYIHDKSLQNYDEYKKHVIEEYKDKKVLALTFDDGPRKVYRRTTRYIRKI